MFTSSVFSDAVSTRAVGRRIIAPYWIGTDIQRSRRENIQELSPFAKGKFACPDNIFNFSLSLYTENMPTYVHILHKQTDLAGGASDLCLGGPA